MKGKRFTEWTLAALILWGAAQAGRAADTPAEQDKKTPTREDWQKMTPEERQAKMKELRDKQKTLTPEQREAQRKIYHDRIAKQLEELRKKKTAGPLTPAETKRLENMEEWMKRMEQGQPSPAGAGNLPGRPADKPQPPAEPK